MSLSQRAGPDSAGVGGVEAPTDLVGDSEGSVQAVILNNSAAPLWRADSADVGHA